MSESIFVIEYSRDGEEWRCVSVHSYTMREAKATVKKLKPTNPGWSLRIIEYRRVDKC